MLNGSAESICGVVGTTIATMNEYTPDSISPPGETIGETLILRNMTRRAFADAMHYGEATIYRLLNGQKRITPAVALQLEKVLDVPAEFWLRREAVYSAFLGRKFVDPDSAHLFTKAVVSAATMTAGSCPFCLSMDTDIVDLCFEYGDTCTDTRVQCKQCGAYGPTADDPLTAISLWNKRGITSK